MRKKTVTITWMDGHQEMYTTYGSVDVSDTQVIITSYNYERDLPGAERQHIPLANIRIWTIERP